MPIVPGGFSNVTVIILGVVLGSSAIMSGLSGFGFAAIGAISLRFLPPS
jgi:uncharacterized protein